MSARLEQMLTGYGITKAGMKRGHSVELGRPTVATEVVLLWKIR